MRSFIFLMALALSFPAFAQQKPKAGAQGPEGRKAPKKSNANPKAKAGSQEWGRFTSNGDKSMAEQEQNKQAKKNAAKK
jgi:hypothetical protein